MHMHSSLAERGVIIDTRCSTGFKIRFCVILARSCTCLGCQELGSCCA